MGFSANEVIPSSPSSNYDISGADVSLETAIAQAKIDLQAIATAPNLIPKLEIAFGTEFDHNIVNSLFQSFANGDFSTLPSVEILPADMLPNANGAFAASTGMV